MSFYNMPFNHPIKLFDILFWTFEELGYEYIFKNN